jgi:hypothetical protein
MSHFWICMCHFWDFSLHMSFIDRFYPINTHLHHVPCPMTHSKNSSNKEGESLIESCLWFGLFSADMGYCALNRHPLQLLKWFSHFYYATTLSYHLEFLCYHLELPPWVFMLPPWATTLSYHLEFLCYHLEPPPSAFMLPPWIFMLPPLSGVWRHLAITTSCWVYIFHETSSSTCPVN